MEVIDPNNIKIYNLSAGKSLPDWLSDRKRRALQKKDVDIRKRIELIQDFDMPGVSTTVKVSKDGQYILATGIYKPRVKCFDVNNLSLKFERGFDSEVVTFEILSDDYSKLVFLQCDRFVEFHTAPGRWFRLRIPKFGRDMKYHTPSCDLYLAGAGSEIYRLNLERGQFLNPLAIEGTEVNKCLFNPHHQLFICGTKEGKVEAFDPRNRSKISVLDCALDCTGNTISKNFPSVTSLCFQGALTLGVGTQTGHVLLYDIRTNKPFQTKDHMYGLPIKDIDFDGSQNLVLSMDSSVVKIWEKNSGKIFTSIESKYDLNNLCLVPKTGMMFMANESTKILTYYIPSLGPAPRWCGFLDNITEELEESKLDTVYDDYKFVTRQELDELGLSDLLGTKLLRAYMHGFFIDIRLYKKAKSVADPFAFDKYKKKRIREKIEEERQNRVQLQKLPKVNKDLAIKLMNPEINKKNKSNVLEDTRFKALFENPDFEIDKNAEEYRLLNPVLSKLDKDKRKELKRKLTEHFEEVEDEIEGKNSSEEETSSSEDDAEYVKEVKRQHKLIRRERAEKEREEERNKELKFYELRDGEEFQGIRHLQQRRVNRKSLGDRLMEEKRNDIQLIKGIGNRQMKFHIKKENKNQKQELQRKKHYEERKKVIRKANHLGSKVKPKFWMGKRVV